MQKIHVLALAAIFSLAVPSIALADTVTVVPTDPTAAPGGGNFGTPTLGAPVGYTISVSDNGTSYIVVLSTTEAIVGPFANLYFDTIADTPNTGSNLGFETTNYDAFIPGSLDPNTPITAANVPGYSAVFVADGVGGTITVTIPNTFFLDDPLGLGFTKTANGGDVSLHLSQTFGYTVVGGSANYPAPVELGEAVVSAASPVPEPAGIDYMAISGLFALVGAGRRAYTRLRA